MTYRQRHATKTVKVNFWTASANSFIVGAIVGAIIVLAIQDLT